MNFITESIRVFPDLFPIAGFEDLAWLFLLAAGLVLTLDFWAAGVLTRAIRLGIEPHEQPLLSLVRGVIITFEVVTAYGIAVIDMGYIVIGIVGEMMMLAVAIYRWGSRMDPGMGNDQT